MGTDENEKLTPVFLTMHADPSMSIWEWERHCEELRIAVARSMPVTLWRHLAIFGPSNNGFSHGSIAIHLRATETITAAIVGYLADQGEWFTLPVTVHPVKEPPQ